MFIILISTGLKKKGDLISRRTIINSHYNEKAPINAFINFYSFTLQNLDLNGKPTFCIKINETFMRSIFL